MTELKLNIPAKRVSGWVVETDPEYLRAWIAALPLADSAEVAREIHQALFALNRQSLDIGRRIELLEVYARPLAVAVAGLQGALARSAYPLPPRKRELAELARELYLEMATGFKCCLHDLHRRRFPWGKKPLYTLATQRALHYLGEALQRCYLAYLPPPAGLWRELHELYRYAEETGRLDEVPAPIAGVAAPVAIGQRYRQILLLAAAGPYQMPANEAIVATEFLGHWTARTQLSRELAVADAGAQFLVDLGADAPPRPYPRRAPLPSGPQWRRLDARALAASMQEFVARLQKGEPARALGLGVECLDSACLELLQRLGRSLGLAAQREHSRIKRLGYVSLCSGIHAVHFFASGQQLFAATASTVAVVAEPTADDALYVALDEPSAVSYAAGAAGADGYRLDRWQVLDVSPKGLALARLGSGGAPVRIGDLVGVQRAGEAGRWSVGAVRWLKSPVPERVELGVELFAPRLTPVVVSDAGAMRAAEPALLLPAMHALHRPATLVVPRALRQEGADLLLHGAGEGPARRVRVLEVLERTPAFERVVYAELGEGA